MLQQTTISSLSIDTREFVRKSWLGHVIQSMRSALWWPDSFLTFILFLALLAVITVAMIMHIYLSSQILEARFQLTTLEQEYAAIERSNAELVWQLSQHMALPVVSERAQTLGYMSTEMQVHYVAAADLTSSMLAARDTQPRVAGTAIGESTERNLHEDALAQSNTLANVAAVPVIQVANAGISAEFVAPPMGQLQSLMQNTSRRFQNWWYGALAD